MNEEKFPFEQSYYTPEKWIVLKDNIYAAQNAICIGLEHIEEEIGKYESSSPTRQNLKYLEILKNEKLTLVKALEGLAKPATR